MRTHKSVLRLVLLDRKFQSDWTDSLLPLQVWMRRADLAVVQLELFLSVTKHGGVPPSLSAALMASVTSRHA